MTVTITKNGHGRQIMKVNMGYGDTLFMTEVALSEVIEAMVNSGYTVERIS